ncbi:2,3-bisphosphoglycerate-independent phosphoglycerate mutase [Dictyocaulus viviparus]|uniref:phosphoglycerate mutase (2,3-diphosphoglycerate-independent) n=1 Tax=Dictyocaulus viviparus TaxID=29172 RepID=A0A0D8XT87_DICVI|nr:2,3-bisphosphoglycerate-independent phosphoglycerate mutase [Dictyocaulus viviparus]
MTNVTNRVCLIVIDGWGISEHSDGNAIKNANTPVMNSLCSGNWTQIEAHGLHVGLPEGLMGNSEVGHLNIGSGRPIYQDIVRINLSIKENTLVKNEHLVEACNRAKSGNGRMHLAGLVSDGGVHSHIDHLFALLKAIKELGVPECYLHFYGDGRDTSPTSGVGFLEKTIAFMNELKYGQLATVVGRYYAMDRDKRWERICVAYEAMIGGKGEAATVDQVQAIVRKRYEAQETDEFLKPIILNGDKARVKDGDTLIFFDYRADRMREISEVVFLIFLSITGLWIFVVKLQVMGMERYKDCKSALPHPKNVQVIGMTQYKAEFPFPSLFPPLKNKNVLAEWLASKLSEGTIQNGEYLKDPLICLGLTQFHCAETEKYAHVTFFFNGGVEKQFDKEERCMVPSPKVATYDLKPEMSSAGVADKMVEQIKLKKHPFVMCNFAPPDMVGHTGVYEAAVKACEATDVAIGRIYEACKANDYVLLVTADHGNAEKMKAPDGSKHTAHTCNPVPFTCSSSSYKFKKLNDRAAALCDVAPTVLEIMGLPKPPEMTGVSLVDKV